MRGIIPGRRAAFDRCSPKKRSIGIEIRLRAPSRGRYRVDLVDLGRQAIVQARAYDLADVEYRRVGDLIEDPQALLAPADEPGLLKNPEVLGDVGLQTFHFVDDLSDGHLAVPQRMQDLQPHGFGENLEPVRDHLQRRLGKLLLLTFRHGPSPRSPDLLYC